jgi:hypothetical protein
VAYFLSGEAREVAALALGYAAMPSKDIQDYQIGLWLLYLYFTAFVSTVNAARKHNTNLIHTVLKYC